MRIGDDARKCVVYLGQKKNKEDTELNKDETATGFFITALFNDMTTWYLVTNKHVAQTIAESPFYIRFNKKESEESWLQHIESVEWTFHSDDSVDIGVIEYRPPEHADVLAFPIEHSLDDEKIIEKQIGPGDITYVVGLFKRLPGTKRALPVVHTGHLALQSSGSERIPSKWNGTSRNIKAHLVQAHTLQGSSGSPVFIKRSIVVVPAEDTGVVPRAFGALFLLGIWQGTFETIAGDNLAHDVGITPNDRVSVGYGVVVPGYQIREILELPKLKKLRDDAAAMRLYVRSDTNPQSFGVANVSTDVSVTPSMTMEDFRGFLPGLSKRK